MQAKKAKLKVDITTTTSNVAATISNAVVTSSAVAISNAVVTSNAAAISNAAVTSSKVKMAVNKVAVTNNAVVIVSKVVAIVSKAVTNKVAAISNAVASKNVHNINKDHVHKCVSFHVLSLLNTRKQSSIQMQKFV